MTKETAITLPLDSVERLLAMAMHHWEPTEEDRAAIKLVDREIQQVREMSSGA